MCGLTQSLQLRVGHDAGAAATAGDFATLGGLIVPGRGHACRTWSPKRFRPGEAARPRLGTPEQVVDAGPSEGEGRQGSAEEVLDLASLSAPLLGGRIPGAEGSAD